jgi:LPXTG-motif cell wall-anchored protein
VFPIPFLFQAAVLALVGALLAIGSWLVRRRSR